MTTRRTFLAGGLAVVAGPHLPGDDRPELLDEIAGTAALGVLAEVHDPGRVWRGTAGVAELGTTRPVRPDSRFRAGSVTKPFVATVVLQLAGERRLGLDDPLARHLPGVLPDAARITLRQLLQHTGGVPNYTNQPAFRSLLGSPEKLNALRFRTWTPAELIAYVHDVPLLFPPGSSWTYSNTGYLLLAMVIEHVTGRSYRDEVGRRVLRPLGLNDTRLPGADPRIHGPHPHGYLPGAAGPLEITDLNPTVAGASGELVTTTADLNRFLAALLTGRLLRPAELAEMLTPRVTGKDYDYGLGLMTRRRPDGVRLWGHGGDIFGYQAIVWSTADGRHQVAAGATPWGTGDLDALFDRLALI